MVYNRLICGLRTADVDLNRKVLADLAMTEPARSLGGRRRDGPRARPSPCRALPSCRPGPATASRPCVLAGSTTSAAAATSMTR